MFQTSNLTPDQMALYQQMPRQLWSQNGGNQMFQALFGQKGIIPGQSQNPLAPDMGPMTQPMPGAAQPFAPLAGKFGPGPGTVGGGITQAPVSQQLPLANPNVAYTLGGQWAQGGQPPNPLANMKFGGGVHGNLFQRLMQQWQATQGRASGATGTRGPEPSPFLGLNRFMGPFGNGGGKIMPGPANPAPGRFYM